MYSEINPSPRTIMAPGPVEADPRVLRAMTTHIIGQFDPEFTAIMNETMKMVREVFQTQNEQAYTVDTTSRGGIETVLTAAICPGDKVLIPAFGRFGYLLAEILERCGADIHMIERPWGEVFAPEEIEAELKKGGYRAVACIHGETSTSMMQPLKEIGAICKQYGALLIVDTVATLGGVEVKVDDWKLDACISGTQKCISAPSGSALITYDKEIEKIIAKRKKVEAGIEETLTYCDFPSEHWVKIRTNNVIERMNREIRRRTRVVGAFPDGNSALMLVCARLRHVAGTQWGCKKYMKMKG